MIQDNELAVSVAVMTHPRRLAQAERLAASHPELAVRVVVDPEPERPTSVTAALAAWAAVEPGATHHIVLQDDVILCDNFAEQVVQAIRAHPTAAISLFAEWGSRSATMVRLAALRGLSFAAAADPFTPTQGLVLQTETAAKLVADSVGEHAPDDVVVSRFLRLNGVPSIVTGPNLLDHDDRPSLTGNGFQGPRRSVAFSATADLGAGGRGVAGEEFDFLPHLDWWRLVAEWFACGPDGEPGWFGAPLAERLPAGLDVAERHAQYTAALTDIDKEGELRGTLTDIVLFELWQAYFALGLISDTDAETIAERLTRPATRAAFATAFPGAVRRALAAEAIARLTGPATELVLIAVQAGAEAAASLGQPIGAEAAGI